MKQHCIMDHHCSTVLILYGKTAFFPKNTTTTNLTITTTTITTTTTTNITGRLTLQETEFARKEKWKKNGPFWQSAEFARNRKGNAMKNKVEAARKANCKEWNLERNGSCNYYYYYHSRLPFFQHGVSVNGRRYWLQLRPTTTITTTTTTSRTTMMTTSTCTTFYVTLCSCVVLYCIAWRCIDTIQPFVCNASKRSLHFTQFTTSTTTYPFFSFGSVLATTEDLEDSVQEVEVGPVFCCPLAGLTDLALLIGPVPPMLWGWLWALFGGLVERDPPLFGLPVCRRRVALYPPEDKLLSPILSELL